MLPSSEQVSTFTILTPPPMLNYSRRGSELVFGWPTSAGDFGLEYTTAVPSTNWMRALPAPVVVGELNVVTNTVTGETRFYRLRKP
jgi:hypothetical protein